MECGAILDVVRLLGVVPAKNSDRGKELLVRVVSMLTRMCRQAAAGSVQAHAHEIQERARAPAT